MSGREKICTSSIDKQDGGEVWARAADAKWMVARVRDSRFSAPSDPPRTISYCVWCPESRGLIDAHYPVSGINPAISRQRGQSYVVQFFSDVVCMSTGHLSSEEGA